MQTTANYALNKPDPSDTYNKANDNTNMDAIDHVLFSLGQSVQQLFGTTTVLLSGGVSTKDGTTPSQLDVTAADIYFTGGQHKGFVASSANQFKTSVVSTTYYLDYNPDGTTSWGTTHSTVSGYTPICSVATDASGNISIITDTRSTISSLLSSKGFVMQSQMGQASGVASLDNTGKIPVAQVPTLDYIPTSEIGAASGVAPLDATSKVPVANLPAMNYVPTSSEGVANGVATTDANNKVVQTANQSDKLSTARTISLSGDATGSATFDGSANEAIAVTLANSGVTAGTYPKVTVDAKGRVTVGSGLASVDVTNALGFTPLSTAGTAANSNELGGQAPSYYATASQANSSASGTWTPASGTFNKPQGTVINVAAVPSGANMYMCMFGGGQQPAGISPSMVGVTTSAGSSWIWGSNTSSGNIGAAYSNGISGSTNGSGNPVLYDGTYSTQGYFQINGGYLQFVCAIAGSAASGTADTIRWAVS